MSMSMNAEVLGYAYHTNRDISERFEVIRTDRACSLGQLSILQAATDCQRIIHNALTGRFAEKLTEYDVRKTANPDNEEMIGRQMGRLAEATGGEGMPLYLHARLPISFSPDWYVAGIGKLKYADGRPRLQRVLRGDNPANLADISDIYIQSTDWRSSDIGLQRRGIGSAILRTMLDHCPEDMPAVVYEFPQLERGIPDMVKRMGFRESGKSRATEFCGVTVEQVTYRGPLCGDIIEALEAKQPWLTDREPVTVQA
jgi:hypothetical protein